MHAFQSNSYNPYLNQYYLLNEVDPRKQWALLSTEEDDQATTTISNKFIALIFSSDYIAIPIIPLAIFVSTKN